MYLKITEFVDKKDIDEEKEEETIEDTMMGIKEN